MPGNHGAREGALFPIPDEPLVPRGSSPGFILRSRRRTNPIPTAASDIRSLGGLNLGPGPVEDNPSKEGFSGRRQPKKETERSVSIQPPSSTLRREAL